jgi:hypothetical protein
MYQIYSDLILKVKNMDWFLIWTSLIFIPHFLNNHQIGFFLECFFKPHKLSIF